jgi:hypothetical protein
MVPILSQMNPVHRWGLDWLLLFIGQFYNSWLLFTNHYNTNYSSQILLALLGSGSQKRGSSASGLTSSQSGDRLTPISDCWLQLVLFFSSKLRAELTNCHVSTQSTKADIFIKHQHGPHRKHRFHSSPIVASHHRCHEAAPSPSNVPVSKAFL